MIAVVSTFFVDAIASLGIVCVLAIGCVYLFVYARRRLVSNAPEEELYKLEGAGQELRWPLATIPAYLSRRY